MGVPDVGSNVGKAISEAPIGDLVLSIATGIAEAQQKLDTAMLRSAILLTGEYEDEDGKLTKSYVKFDGEDVALLELGFTPTFYQFVDTTIEVKISLSMTASESTTKMSLDVNAKAEAEGSLGLFSGDVRKLGSVTGTVKANVSAVSVSNTSKYQYSAEASSTLRTRIVPLPPPPLLDERLRRILDKRYPNRTK